MIYTYIREITSAQVDELVSFAIQGMDFWADEIVIKLWHEEDSIPEDVKDTSEALTHGLRLRIHNAEEDRWHILSLTKLLRGLRLCNIDLDNYDMYEADKVVQYALFGDHKYF